MDGESLRELRYRERERKAIENMRRQALLEIQEQREALVQARAEARARQEELDSQERTQRDVSSNVSAQRDDTLGTYISPISDSHKLDFAGKLYTPDDSLLTIDVAGSQYSVSPLAKSEKEIVIGEQRDVNTQEEEFEKMLKKLKSQIDSSHVDSVTRQKSLLSNPQTEENIIIKKEPDISKSKISGSGIDSRSAEKVAPNISMPLDDDDDEESQLRAKIERMALHQKELEEKRMKMQNIEKEMERRLKDLKETERKERLRALQKQAENMEYELFQSQKEDREWQDRIQTMNLETQKLKDRIAKNEISDLSHERLPDSSVYDTCKLKHQETDKVRLLEEELKRRETLIKQEMLKEAQENICADKKAINAEKKHREEQIRMQFEKELDKKEKELKDKELMLLKYKVQRDYQKNIIDPELLKRQEELKKKELYLKKLEQEVLGGDNHQKCETKREAETDVTYYMNPGGDSYEKFETKKEAETKTKADVTHFLKPYLTQFSGTEPELKNESSFEDWKAETQCLIKSKVYPDYIVSQAIRNSLKGQARKALSTLDPLTNSDGIISKLESLFGNVASGLSILQEFFTAVQNSDETVTMWGLRIEEILQRAIEKGEVPSERRNHLLKDKFWRSLHSFDLKIATKVYFDKISDFEVLRSKVREERELKTHKTTIETASSNIIQPGTTPKDKLETSGELQHNPVHTETGADRLYNDIAKRLEKIENMCSNRQNRRYNQNRRWNDRKNEQKDKSDDKKSEQKSDTLNRDRPPLKGK